MPPMDLLLLGPCKYGWLQFPTRASQEGWHVVSQRPARLQPR
jgi:hypothetical protein